MKYIFSYIFYPVCGAEVIDKNVALSEKAEKVKQFYNDLTEATQDVLKQVNPLII